MAAAQQTHQPPNVDTGPSLTATASGPAPSGQGGQANPTKEQPPKSRRDPSPSAHKRARTAESMDDSVQPEFLQAVYRQLLEGQRDAQHPTPIKV